jgi:hypothetical protein
MRHMSETHFNHENVYQIVEASSFSTARQYVRWFLSKTGMTASFNVNPRSKWYEIDCDICSHSGLAVSHFTNVCSILAASLILHLNQSDSFMYAGSMCCSYLHLTCCSFAQRYIGLAFIWQINPIFCNPFCQDS